MIVNTGYSYNDLTVIPAVCSRIKSRSEINPYYEDNMFPIFTAPMSTVVDEQNYNLWLYNKINPILPRNIEFSIRKTFMDEGKWVALSLSEFNNMFIVNKYFIKNTLHVLIDVANGHMNHLIETIKNAKSLYGDKLIIMSGNIANPETYKAYCEAGCDYVRCSIGSGAGCLTTSNTGIHYPIASLIYEINKIKVQLQVNNKFTTKIIADGGIRNYSDVIKALALGADYVMVGSLFAGFLESAAHIIDGVNYIDRHVETNKEILETLQKVNPNIDFKHKIIIQYIYGTLERYYEYKEKYEKYPAVEIITSVEIPNDLQYIPCYVVVDTNDINLPEWMKRYMVKQYNYKKEFFGMSTKRAQQMIKNDCDIKTSEGTYKIINVEYTIKQWVDNMDSYLRSAMSYCNAFNLNEFIGKVDLICNSYGEVMSVNK